MELVLPLPLPGFAGVIPTGNEIWDAASYVLFIFLIQRTLKISYY